MRKILMFFMVAISATAIAFGQDASKLSISTQMFLDEQAGKLSLEQPADFARGPKAKSITDDAVMRYAKFDRPIVKPVEKDGKKVISAFIRVADRSVLSELEALGVEIECEFLDGTLFTTLIPVDMIGKVADLAKVKSINVATKRRPFTNMARQYSNVDDVLSYSTDARNAGLPNAYDGSGVLLGVIDTGIDFQHKAFKDANGNFRIKRAYVYSGSGTAKEYGDGASYSLTTSAPTTDDSSEDHGTHTSSTAGGSSVTISGSTTTVTTDHANATYGGMAPGADLYLAGCDLSETYLANSFQKIVNYADSKGLPVVVSNSWGGQFGPHDGTGDIADIVNQYFSDSNPNHICLFAASNDAGTNGFHVSGTATSASPLGTVMNYNTDYGLSYFYGIIANAWTRSTGVTLNCKLIVLNSSGSKVTEVSVNPSSSGSSVSLGSTYASGSLYAYRNYVDSEKSGILLYTSGLQMRSGYKLAVQFYPSNGSSVVDIWSGSLYTYYTSTPSTSGYTWTAGSDNMCVSDEATIANGISIGAYSTKNRVTDYNNSSHTLDYTVGDIADFSSWATAAASPTGLSYPWICAPGATVVSGVNAYDTSGDYSYINGNSASYGMYRVNTDTTNPYGSMEGTSMATPCAAGIVALWLQVAKENNIELTTSDIKTIMKETAITDSYTNGTNASHFGNGKIDALAGVKYILDNYVQNDNPTITANPTSIDFGNVTAGSTATQTFTVTGANLEGNIALAKSGNNFAIDKTSITKNSDGSANATVTVTFSPTANVSQTNNGTVTLTSSNATSVTVNLTGKGVYNAPVIAANPTSLSFTGNSGSTYTKTVTVTGSNLQGNITAAIQNDANGFYSVSPASFNAASQTVTVTWAPTAGGTSTANLVLTTTGTGANTVTVPITGTAQGPTIAANPTSVTFSGYATQTYTQTVTVTGTNLSQNITASLTGADVYSIDKTSLAKTGGTITVTYAPTAAGNTNATLTLSSTGASTVTVPITGTAQAATPTLIVEPASLTFSDGDRNKTFAVTGRFINEDVTLTLNDASGAFTLGTTTIPTANISETNAVNVTVTFNGEEEGDYTGTVTVASNGATSQTVNLSATISTGGTASDNYLNIAKYATIDEAGWNTSLVNKIYEYKEYDSDEVAWLTLPMYGAFVGAKYATNSTIFNSGSPQKWIETSVSSTNQIGSTTWSATDIYLGSSNYFTSNTEKAVGTNSNTSKTEKSVTFYVTNTTAVKLYASQRSTSTTYPTTLKIYECTDNGDGTLTSSSSTVKNGSLTTSGVGSISLTELDASKVYKVVASQARGYLYEIGFQTPLNKESLTASPTGIDFIAEPGETITETITVTGARLTEDVTVTLTDENGVYTLDKNSISIAEATNGATVTVTFNAPQAMGSYRGQATFTSGQATAKTVFYGAVGEKGTAYSNYLDIAQYQTIATGNWYDGIFANAYKWTEYEDDECAWLTVPAALPYFAWNYNDQNWCGVSSNSNGGWYGHQWTATDVFQGYEYFKRADLSDENGDYAHMMGGDESNSTSNTTIFYGIYNVTNCTQVKAYAYNNSGVSSTYPAFIQIYELTENADGTLTQSDTRTDIQTSTTSGAVTMTSAELDANKIYFVAVGGYRGFTYEVAFRTPLTTTEATLAEIESNGVKNQKYKVSDKLLAVYAAGDQGILWCKDLNNASIAPTYKTDGQYDYMRDIVCEQSCDWDQSNWVALQFSTPDSENGVKALVVGAVGSYVKAGTIVGTYSDSNNYTITMAEDALQLEDCNEEYFKNVYCTANFLPGNLNINGGKGAPGRYHGADVYYFFMNPKVQEVCEITYAQWDGTKFVVPYNDSQIEGAFTVDWSLNEEGPKTPTTGEAYRFTAVVNRSQNSSYLKDITGNPSSDFVVSPLDFTGVGEQVVTAINGIYTDGYREVVGVDYVNVAGMISDKPFQGVNIVVTRYSDGSKTTSKKVFK